MMCCCNSNPAQYERNRRFRHLVYVLGWGANGAKLPSVGLWLNASKSESCLEAMINWVCRAFEAGSDTFSCRSMVFLVCLIQTPISYVIMWCCATGSNQLYTTLIDPSVVNDRAILTLRFVETHLKWSLICLEVEKWLLLLFDFFYFLKVCRMVNEWGVWGCFLTRRE